MYPAMHVRYALNPSLKVPQLRGCIIIVRNNLLFAICVQRDQCCGLISAECATWPDPVFVMQIRKPDPDKSLYQALELSHGDCRCFTASRRYVLLTLV